MKKNKLIVGLVAVMALVAALPLSAAKKKDGSVQLKEKEVNFKSAANGRLTIENQTNDDVVVFIGRVEKAALLGGIKANSNTVFDLKTVPHIPKSGSALIRVATFETYKKRARVTEDDVIYTGLVVYNLDDDTDRSTVSIFKGVDTQQQTCIYVSNESENFVLELRKDNPSQGEVIATLAPLTTNKKIYLAPREGGLMYDFYPTFVYVNPNTNEKTSMNAGKTDRKRTRPQPVGGKITPIRFEGPSAGSVGYDVAFIHLENNTESSIEFRNAGEILADQKGERGTLSGGNSTYEIASLNGDGGQMYTALTMEFDDFTKKTVKPMKFLPGYVYELHVTGMDGNYNYDIEEKGRRSLTSDSRISLFGE